MTSDANNLARFYRWVEQGYRDGIITASRAAEISGLDIRHFLATGKYIEPHMDVDHSDRLKAAEARAALVPKLVAHLRLASDCLQATLEAGVEVVCPQCRIPMPCNGDAGWICCNSKCQEGRSVFETFGVSPYMDAATIAEAEKVMRE